MNLLAPFLPSIKLPPQSWWEKWVEARVNINAHCVPSRSRTIWIHTILWRTNNLEETHQCSPTPDCSLKQTSSLPAFYPLIRSPCTLVILLDSLLSSCPPRCALLPFHAYVPSHNILIINNHWNVKPEISSYCQTLRHSHSTNVFIEREQQCNSNGMFSAEPHRGLFADCWDSICNMGFIFQPAESLPSYHILSLSPYVGHRSRASGKDVLFRVIICRKINI